MANYIHVNLEGLTGERKKIIRKKLNRKGFHIVDQSNRRIAKTWLTTIPRESMFRMGCVKKIILLSNSERDKKVFLQTGKQFPWVEVKVKRLRLYN